MSYFYNSDNAKILKIGTINDDIGILQNFLDMYITSNIKLCKNISMNTTQIGTDYVNYNFLFLLLTFDNLSSVTTYEMIKNIVSGLTTPLNHLFIVVDNCPDLTIDDDGDLVFVDDNNNQTFNNFDNSLSEIMPPKLYHLFKISIENAIIWKNISNNRSIVTLTENQINLIASQIIKKSKNAKLSFLDKKKEIKILLKKIVVDDKLAETGYTDFYENVVQYFKLLYQKKIVCQNYVTAFKKINISLNKEDMDNVNMLLKEIYEVTFLKTEMHKKLTDQISVILLEKIKNYYIKCKNNVSICPTKQPFIDANVYHNLLVSVMDIAKVYNLPAIIEVTKSEIGYVNNIIVEHHKKEVEKITDLDKLSHWLQIFASNGLDTLINMFEKICAHPKIMSENIEKMDKWVMFIDKCLKLSIPLDAIIKLTENIIMNKINFYNDMRLNKNITIIYPQCLQIFLSMNIDKHFSFKKLYMYLSYHIRYSGKNIIEYIKNITENEYKSMLILEEKMLQLCDESIDIHNQSVNLNDTLVVKT